MTPAFTEHTSEPAVYTTDVLVVGSGPVGATYARKLVDAGIEVLMVEIGSQENPIPGEHKKNAIAYQKDLNSFSSAVNAELNLLSVPTTPNVFPTTEPISFSSKGTIHNGQNPRQDAFFNIPAAGASRTVGGMGAHWTCCTPEEHPKIERSNLFSNDEWESLYAEARSLIGTTREAFEKSIRQQLVKRTLQKAWSHTGREFLPMPLAVKRSKINFDYLTWGSPATVFGNITRTVDRPGAPNFTLLPEHRCTRIEFDTYSNEINGVLGRNLRTNKDVLFKAKKYVICAGSVLTPGILYNSGLQPKLPALGRYLSEQIMTFCQIILKKSLIDEVPRDPYGLGWDKIAAEHHKKHPSDPLPFPFNDPDPQVTSPVSEKFQWHTQIHRDAFTYGQIPPDIDQRTVVDLRFYCKTDPHHDNYVEFTNDIKDTFGMPQPTFHFQIKDYEAKRAHEMMLDMQRVAGDLGGYVPGQSPHYLPPGSALHITGTTRAGTSEHDSVCNKNGKVWGTNDLYVGGNGVIPTGTACNPTLTSMCFAIVAANTIIAELGKDAKK
ncbi:MAG: hypothetical protein Q9157_005196 [Trypethelium eluteriae]